MDLQSDQFALKSDQVEEGFNQICKTLIEGVLPISSKESMTLTYIGNDLLTPLSRKDSLRQDLQRRLTLDKQSFRDERLCIDPLCFQETRQIQEQCDHKDHKTITLQTLLTNLKVLKCNNIFKTSSQSQIDILLRSLNKINKEIEAFQNEMLTLIRNAKIKTWKHITEVQQSFEDRHYKEIKQKVIGHFNYQNVMYALGEIDKFEMIKYDNLEYPVFKTSVVLGRIQEHVKYKEVCINGLQDWTDSLLGKNNNYNKVFNRSSETFMFKSPTEKRIFSYYLRGSEYIVSDFGKRLKRTDFTQDLPLAVIEKRLGKDKILIKVNKMGKKGVTIGCGILKQMENAKFNNCYRHGFFLHSRGIVFSQQTQKNNIFKYSQKDIISIHKEDYRIYFHKIQEGKVVDGFYVTLKHFEEEGTLNRTEKYYAAVFLGDPQAQVQVLS